jgi:type III pantothenate kinase
MIIKSYFYLVIYTIQNFELWMAQVLIVFAIRYKINYVISTQEKIMLLCIDIGNTNITLGIYQGDKLGPRWRLATIHNRMPDEFGIQIIGLLDFAKIQPNTITKAVIASVVPPLTEKWAQVCRNYLGCEPLIITAATHTGVNILIDEPQAVGADRIVDAAAAYRVYGGPACIVDFGTATTFDAISAEGDYLGGAIAPGIGIAAEALFQRAAKLPKVDIQRPPAAIAKNTKHAMQSGLLFGYVGLVEGMVVRFRQELGPEMKVIATGGLARLIAAETQVLEFVAPWLTLDGLRMIYELNVELGKTVSE